MNNKIEEHRMQEYVENKFINGGFLLMSYMIGKKLVRSMQDDISANFWFDDIGEGHPLAQDFKGVFKIQILKNLDISIQKVRDINDDGK